MFQSHVRFSVCAAFLAGAAVLYGSGVAPSMAGEQGLAKTLDAAPATDKARVEEALKGLNRGRGVSQVAVSPDGMRLAWVEQSEGAQQILVAPITDLKQSERVPILSKPDERCQQAQPVWSPDSGSLAFLSVCPAKGEQANLFLSHLDGQPARRLTAAKGDLDAPAFSPDGNKIAFLYVEGATRRTGALAAIKPWSGVIGEDGIEIQRVALVATNNAAPVVPAWATPAKLHVYEFDWRPDSRGLAYVAAEPPGENNWWVARLFTQWLNGEARAILSPAEVAGPLHGLQIAVPKWSPDGKAIAFIGGLMSDQGATGGDVWLVPAEGGVPRNLSPGRQASASWVEWGSDKLLYATELAGGNQQLVGYHMGGDRTRPDGASSAVRVSAPLFSVPGSEGDGRLEMSLSATSDHALFVFRASTFDQPAEIYAAKVGATPATSLGGLTQLSHLNDGVTPAWGKSVSLTWKSDQFQVQGWLMLPRNYDPAKRYPLIVRVHGGPGWAVESVWGGSGGLSAEALSALGYFVLQPNPRGSFGQGEAFTQANRRDFGYGDLRDILAGVDAVTSRYPVDVERVGVTGWSYGGFQTMFAVTQTHRFKAAVAGAGISNWQSYYGENSIDQWMRPYFGASVYDDPAIYAKSSAINFIKNVTTPTLIVVGDRDGECPAPQSFEFWHALRSRGVATQLVVYPNEGHGFVDPIHRSDVMLRTVEWFNRYLQREN
jgi:dipeptidyl aminopeptidase/acylaminoacyl peptidase